MPRTPSRFTIRLVSAVLLTLAPLVQAPAVAADAPGAQSADQSPEGGATATPKIVFEKYTLPNGLQVILHADRKLPIVHVNQWYHVGSKNEKPGRTGFAHLFEHMMFQGSKHAKDEYFSYVERAGANLFEGGVNGTTNQDRTNYFATVPSANLEALLWLESDRLATLAESTTQAKLDNQRDVVKNERRQGLENQPYGRWYPLLTEAVFPRPHPYSWPVIGSQEDLSAATLDDVKEFFRTYYAPNNLTLAVVGDFSPAEAKALVAKYFGDIPPGPALDRPARWVPVLEADKVIEVKDRVQLERVYLGWATPEYFGADDAAMDVIARILADGLASRLNKALVYDRQLATTVSAFNVTGEIGSLFVVQATARPGSTLAEIERTIAEEIARLAREGPTEAELERARLKQESDFITGLERIGGFGGKADILSQYNTFLGDPGRFEEDLARYRGLTTAGVRRAAETWLVARHHAKVRFRPETAQRTTAAAVLDRAKEPPLGADRPFTAPTVKSARLENGLEVLVVERRDLPKVSVRLATRAGSVADPVGKAGTAYLAMRTIDMGTKMRSVLEIESALGDLGTSLAGQAQREVAVLSMDVLQRNLSAALSIVADVVTDPTYPEQEVVRERKRTVDAIAQQERSGEAIATRMVPLLAFGRDHPYGWPVQGFRQSVEAITRQDLVAFYQKRWKPGSTALVFVGDIALDEATALARQHFGSWTGGAATAVRVEAPVPGPAGRIYIVDRPDAAQTVVAQWLPAPRRKSEDYDALVLVDAVWGGGGFGTRLNLNLREDKGYSYGVFSALSLYDAGGLWQARGGVQTSKTRESVVEFDKELKAMAGARPVTAEEFANARTRRLRGYAQQFESLGRIADGAVELWSAGLPMTELQREYDATGRLSLEQVLAAAAKYARPPGASVLLVGDRSRIEPGLRELGLGDVVVLDVEGQPGSSPPKGGGPP